MLVFSKVYVAGFAALVLAGCSGLELDRARAVSPQGSAFQTELYGGYIGLASSEYAEGDYTDSDFFALRAITAAGANAPPPQELAERRLPEDTAPELGQARGLLVDVLARGAAERFPARAADAQVKFDCWMQEQEENFQPDDIAACRGQFLVALSALNAGLTPLAPMAEAAPAPAPAPQPVKLVVFFDFDKADLNAAARVKLDEAVAAIKGRRAVTILVNGHADRAGASGYNAKLSRLRAIAIADALARAGVPPEATTVSAFGELQPMVATEDDVREPSNRRVEIVIQ
ncbi:MAG: OmpA family protein [Proteobacteria bacterium]|nr:OmpA family protein [Pseudomonadota bacterium]